MKAQKAVVRHAGERVPRGHGPTSWTAFVTKPPIRPPRMVPTQRPPEIGPDQRRRFSSPMAGLKPTAHGNRRMPPFGSPKGEGGHERTRRNTGGVARRQVDPPRAGTGARVRRHRRWRDRSPHRSPFNRQPRLRRARLNGFPGVLAEVYRHRVGGGGRRVPDAVPTGSFGAANVREPAYPTNSHRFASSCVI